MTERKDEILSDFVGKDILVGWHGCDYVVDGNGIPLDITFVKNDADKIVFEGDYDYERIKVVDSTIDKNTKQISILPRVDKMHFFTVTENSILKRKRL